MRAGLTGLTNTFNRFVESERSSGLLLLGCTALAIVIANGQWGPAFHHLLEWQAAGLSIEQWINDGLMSVFFLLIGLELERELYSGELSDPRRALLPAVAAVGGMVAPALLHLSVTGGTPLAAGAGIPVATDIAFALGVLTLLGTRVPPALKVFVVAFAVMDDLGAIIVIALFYSQGLAYGFLGAAAAILALLVVLNRRFRVMALTPYLLGGIVMWWCLLRSGVHATLAGVVLAFAIPYSAKDADHTSPSHRLEHLLHRPVAFLIVPVFALANTGVVLGADWMRGLTDPNSVGIMLGLVLGKPIGVSVVAFLAVSAGLCRLPAEVSWRHIVGAGMLGGIGFTMSIFITNLAFAGEPAIANGSKLAILVASVTSGTLGFVWLRFAGRPSAPA